MIFGDKKCIIGMIHLGKLCDQDGFLGEDKILEKAYEDIDAYTKGGVDGLLIENWEDESTNEFICSTQKNLLLNLSKKIRAKTNLFLGINILPNDYDAAFYIAKHANLDFIQLDVFVDVVKTNYIQSKVTPFTISVDVEELKRSRVKHDCTNKLLFTSIHPKHYILLDKKTIEQSAYEAKKHGSDGLIITGTFTGTSPDIQDLKKVASLDLKIPILIGSGLNMENYEHLLTYAKGAIVGTFFKDSSFNKVLLKNVKLLTEAVRTYT